MENRPKPLSGDSVAINRRCLDSLLVEAASSAPSTPTRT